MRYLKNLHFFQYLIHILSMFSFFYLIFHSINNHRLIFTAFSKSLNHPLDIFIKYVLYYWKYLPHFLQQISKELLQNVQDLLLILISGLSYFILTIIFIECLPHSMFFPIYLQHVQNFVLPGHSFHILMHTYPNYYNKSLSSEEFYILRLISYFLLDQVICLGMLKLLRYFYYYLLEYWQDMIYIYCK